mmetsp:Transcript_63222/g.181841  ORF Transcript_63222/g.181841 Transcript_63222/m.181841 type:complete len:145 (-) Transcript_63222:199-633(-)
MFFWCCTEAAGPASVETVQQLAVGDTDENTQPATTNAVEAQAPPAKKDEPEAVAQIAKKSGLTLTFRQDGEDRDIIFDRQPLGFKFMSEKRIIVTAVIEGGVADRAGVKTGMELVAVAGENIIDLAPDYAIAKVKATVGVLSIA